MNKFPTPCIRYIKNAENRECLDAATPYAQHQFFVGDDVCAASHDFLEYGEGNGRYSWSFIRDSSDAISFTFQTLEPQGDDLLRYKVKLNVPAGSTTDKGWTSAFTAQNSPLPSFWENTWPRESVTELWAPCVGNFNTTEVQESKYDSQHGGNIYPEPVTFAVMESEASRTKQVNYFKYLMYGADNDAITTVAYYTGNASGETQEFDFSRSTESIIIDYHVDRAVVGNF